MTTSTEQARPPAGPASASRSRAVAHALSAAGAAMLMCLGIPMAGVVLFAGVPGVALGAVVLLAGSGTVFGLIGSGFLGPRGWWLGFTALPWAAAVFVSWLLGLGTGTGWGPTLTIVIAAGTVGGGCALLGWRGAPRAVGIGVLVLFATAVAVIWMASIGAVEYEAGPGYRGEVPRFTTSVPGYAADEVVVSVGRTTTLYRSGDRSFQLSAEPLDDGACDAALSLASGPEEPEATCAALAERRYRTSATLHEVAVVRGDSVVRATASQTVPLGDLENAIALAIPDGAEWVSDAPG